MAAKKGDRIVGRVGIKALPDTRGFNKELVDQLEKIAQKAILIPIELEEKSFDSMRDRIEKQAERMKIRIKPELDDSEFKRELAEIDDEAKEVTLTVKSDEAALKREERLIKDSFDRIELMRRELGRKMERDAERGVFFNEEHLNKTRDQFADLVRRLEDEAEVKFEVELDPENIELVETQMDDLIRTYEDRNIPLEVVVENFWASQNLNWITRPRTVEIFTKINAQSAAATAAAIAALSGGRLAGEIGSDMWDFFKDLDKNLPMLSFASTAFINLGGTLFGVTSHILSFGAGLMHITPLLLTLPGLILGAAAAAVTLGVAWADVKTELASLEEPFARLGDLMSASYWSEAREPIKEFITDLMPQMETALGGASTALGSFTGALADSFAKEFAGGRFESIFATFSEGFAVLEQGTDGFAGAIVNMAQIAGMYWPRLAGWINDTAGRFDQWLTDISTDGRLSDWMERGIDSLYDLWGGLEAGGRILGGLWNAANNAGADAMAGFRMQMEAWDELVNRPSSQRALRDWFEGGREAAAGLGDAVENIFAPFARNSHLVKETFAASGDAIREFGTVIGNVFGHSKSITGFTAGLESVEQAFRNIEGSAGTLGVFLGETAEFTGEFARILSGPLGTALDVILPRAGEVLSEVLKVSEVLAGAFDEVLSSPQFRGLADDFVTLAGSIADITVALTPLAQGVLQGVVDLFDTFGAGGIVAAAAIGGLVNAAVIAGPAILKFADLFKLFAPAGLTMTGALGGVTAFLGSPWLVPVAAAGTALVVFADYVKSTRATVDELEASLRGGASAAELLSDSQSILQGFDLDSGRYFMVDGVMEYVSWMEKIPDLLDDINASNADGIFGGLHAVDFELAFSGAEEAIGDYDDLLSQMDFESAATGFTRLAESMSLNDDQARELLDLMPGVEEALIAYANQNDIVLDSVDGVIDANQLVALAYEQVTPAADLAAGGIDSVAAASERAAEQATRFHDAQRMLVDAAFASEDAMIRYHDAVGAASAAIVEGFDPALNSTATGFDLSTESGARASQMLQDMVTAAQDSSLALAEQGGASNYVAVKQDEMRAQIEDAARQLGLSDEAARLYAERLLAIPDSVFTEVEASTAAAQARIERFIRDNSGRHIQIIVDSVAGSAPSTIVENGYRLGYEDGGLIPGAPSSTDNMVINAASGEYVINAASTQQYMPLLEAINSGQARSNVIAAALGGMDIVTGGVGGVQPLVGSLTMVSSGDTSDDIDEVMFQLRSMRRGGR